MRGYDITGDSWHGSKGRPGGFVRDLKIHVPHVPGVNTDMYKCDVHTAPEPRWPALISLIAVGGLYAALPRQIAVVPGPSWLLLAVVGVMLIPTVITFQLRHHALNQLFGFAVLGVVTVAEMWSLALLVHSLFIVQGLSPRHLLVSAGALWLTNVFTFALWYWRLDAGGPHIRDLIPGHEEGAFLFPQMTMDDDLKRKTGQENWSPEFTDYLFLAFNHSTALSPTDTAILSRWAKPLVMLQALISLITIAIVASRAVNIIQT